MKYQDQAVQLPSSQKCGLECTDLVLSLQQNKILAKKEEREMGDRYRWFMSTVGELGLNKEECRINNLVVNIIRKIPLPEKNSQEKLNC